MRLTDEQVERFYGIWKPLMQFVNGRLRLGADLSEPWDPNEFVKVRDALWADVSLLDAFVSENPAGLSAEDLATVASWRHRVAGTFYVLRHLKKHSIFLETPGSKVYAVVGLASSLDEVVPFVPSYVQAALLPFEGQIIYDSLISAYNISFGKGIRDSLNRAYADAKERGAIITSLLPAKPPSRAESGAAAGSTNAQVLDAFRTYLYRSGLSPRVVDRDLANVGAFADASLGDPAARRSLREVGDGEVRANLGRLAAAPRRQAATSLKRFFRFLRDTERMDYDSAEQVLDVLKGKE